jgi:hypothetical protein
MRKGLIVFNSHTVIEPESRLYHEFIKLHI